MNHLKSLFWLLAFLHSGAQAQFLSLTDPAGTPVANGDTLIVYGTTNDFILYSTVGVHNASSVSMDVHVFRTELYMVPTTVSYFMFGLLMYPPFVSQSVDPAVIPAGTTDFSFQSGYETNNLPGISYVKYRFYDSNNPADSAWLVIEYNVAQGVGLIEGQTVAPARILPNPGSGRFAIQRGNRFQNDLTIEVLSPQAKLIRTIQFAEGMHTPEVDLSGYPKGVYFFRITGSGGSQTIRVMLF